MNDTSTRSDLLRLGILMGIILAVVISLKVYDDKTGQVGKFGSQIYNKMFTVK